MALFSTFSVESQVFWRSKLSYGIVNLRPIVRGHVLVVPKRVVPRLRDLQPDEVADLFQSAVAIGRVIEQEYGTKGAQTSLTIACQDGPAAGQSVPHVHVHILPRTLGDVEPIDAIYDRLDAWKANDQVAKPAVAPLVLDDEARKPRTDAEMEAEAQHLATLFERQA